MLKIENLYYKTQKFSLSDINFTIEKGEYFVLLGPSAAGKTTLVECIGGIRKISSGRIELSEKDITDSGPETRNIGYLPQNCLLFPNMDVRANIQFGLLVRGYSRNNIEKRTNEIARMLDIEYLLDRSIKKLSGGEKQRVALARAIITNPSLVILDEPFSSVDVGLRLTLWFEVKELLKKLNVPVIHITHNIEEASALGDTVAVIIDGQIENISEPQKFFAALRSEKHARFLGISNIYEGIAADSSPGGFAEITVGENLKIKTRIPANITSREVKVCVRPQDIKILREGEPIKTELKENVFEGVIESECFYGDMCGIRVNCGLMFELRFPAYIHKRHALSREKKIKIALWQPSIVVFQNYQKIADDTPK